MAIDQNIPKNGWIVINMGIGRYVTCGPSLKSLATVLGNVCDEAEDKTEAPTLVYELGRKMAVGLDYTVSLLEPAKE